MNRSKIQWQVGSPYGAGYTWNPITGCTPASEGCERCYAKSIYTRFNKTPFSTIQFHPERLEAPLKKKKPSFIFVSSMGDLFHKDVNIEWIDQILEVIDACPQHTFIALTKRPENMQEKLYGQDGRTPDNYLFRELGGGDYVGNLMLGVSVENQARADERIPLLLRIPAWKTVVSYEPAIEAVDFGEHQPFRQKKYSNNIMQAVRGILANRIDWVIMGAETGPGARPMNLQWARDVRDQCKDAGVPFFFKQDSDGNSTLDGDEQRGF